MDTDEGDASDKDRHTDEPDEHRAAPAGRLIRLVLLDDVDQADVEVLADCGCRRLHWIGLRAYPLLGRPFPNVRGELFAQRVESGRPGHGRRHAGERLQKDRFSQCWLQAKAK